MSERPDREFLSGAEKRPPQYRDRGSRSSNDRGTSERGCGCGRDHGLTRRGFLGATAAAVSASAFSLPAAAEEDDTVTIVHDLHSHSEIGDPEEPNIARYQAVIQEELEVADREDVLFFGSGDELGSSRISFFSGGRHKIDFMNEMNLTGAGVGNHDFDYGPDLAFEKFEKSQFPWLTSNLKTPDGEQLPHTEAYTIEEVGDIRLGVFNVVLEGFSAITDYPDDYIQEDPVERAAEMTDLLREEEECDIVVCASHVRHETHYEIAEAVEGLDAIFGSHSHVTFDEEDVHEGTVISEVGYAYDHIGVLTLDADGDLVEWERVDLDGEDEPVDEAFKGMIEDLFEAYPELFDVVGQATVELDASGAYGRETRLGNLLTDAMLSVHEDAQVAFQNAGGIRSNDEYGPGPVTFEDVLAINPFDNEVVVFEATGEQIRSALGDPVGNEDWDAGSRIDAFPDAPFGAQQGQQVAGVQYEWRGHDGEPEVLEVFVDGEPLDEEETYVVATTGNIWNGSRGYEAFADAPEENVLTRTSETRPDQFEFGWVVREYLESREWIEPTTENRILRVDEPLDSASALEQDGAEVEITVPHPGDPAEEAFEDLPWFRYRLVSRTGDEATATDATVREADGEIDIRFDTADVARLARIEEPALRVYGEFEPDDEHYGYEDEDGTLRGLPQSFSYFFFKFRSAVPDDLVADFEPEGVITESAVELDAFPGSNFDIETTAGNLLTDVMREVEAEIEGAVDVAVQNAGGIDWDAFGPGPVTDAHVEEMLFFNDLEVYELSGSDLLAYLESQVETMPSEFGAGPSIQVSGLSYEWRGHDDEATVESVVVGGETLDENATYRVVTNDFHAGNSLIGNAGEFVDSADQNQVAFTTESLDEREAVAPEREHRIVRVDEYVEATVEADGRFLAISVPVPAAVDQFYPWEFRLLAADGETVTPADVEVSDDGVTVRVPMTTLDAVFDPDAPIPLRLLGGFDPDDEHYGYGEDLPAAEGYDHHKLQAELDPGAVEDALDVPEVTLGEGPATDTTGDGLLNDLDGDEEFDITDVQVLFENLDDPAVQDNAEFFNFNGRDTTEVGIFDVQALFNEL